MIGGGSPVSEVRRLADLLRLGLPGPEWRYMYRAIRQSSFLLDFLGVGDISELSRRERKEFRAEIETQLLQLDDLIKAQETDRDMTDPGPMPKFIDDGETHPESAYFCDKCRGWHLSQTSHDNIRMRPADFGEDTQTFCPIYVAFRLAMYALRPDIGKRFAAIMEPVLKSHNYEKICSYFSELGTYAKKRLYPTDPEMAALLTDISRITGYSTYEKKGWESKDAHALLDRKPPRNIQPRMDEAILRLVELWTVNGVSISFSDWLDDPSNWATNGWSSIKVKGERVRVKNLPYMDIDLTKKVQHGSKRYVSPGCIIYGFPGTGKSTAKKELEARGYSCEDSDDWPLDYSTKEGIAEAAARLGSKQNVIYFTNLHSCGIIERATYRFTLSKKVAVRRRPDMWAEHPEYIIPDSPLFEGLVYCDIGEMGVWPFIKKYFPGDVRMIPPVRSKTRVHVNSLIKNEPGNKFRIAYSTPTETMLEWAKLMANLGRYPFNCSLNRGDLDKFVAKYNSGRYVHVPFDFSAFDHQPTKAEVRLLMESLLRKACVTEEDHEILDRLILRNENLFVRVGEEDIRWENGLLSGEKFTALVGCSLNWVWNTTIGQMTNLVDLIVQGDDAWLIFNNFEDAKLHVALMSLYGFTNNELKFFYSGGELPEVVSFPGERKVLQSTHRSEYLRWTFIEGRAFKPPLRALGAMSESKPWKEHELRGVDSVKVILDAWSVFITRCRMAGVARDKIEFPRGLRRALSFANRGSFDPRWLHYPDNPFSTVIPGLERVPNDEVTVAVPRLKPGIICPDLPWTERRCLSTIPEVRRRQMKDQRLSISHQLDFTYITSKLTPKHWGERAEGISGLKLLDYGIGFRLFIPEDVEYMIKESSDARKLKKTYGARYSMHNWISIALGERKITSFLGEKWTVPYGEDGYRESAISQHPRWGPTEISNLAAQLKLRTPSFRYSD